MRGIVKRSTITLVGAIASAALLLCGCSNDFEANESQREKIVTFLEKSHTPTLIAEDAVADSQSENPPFYSDYGNYAYRYIADYYNPEREAQPEVKSGSVVSLTFKLYEFGDKAITESELPLYTNDASYQKSYQDAGLNTEFWSFEPITITIGEGTLMASFHDGLIGCRAGDVVELYMTDEMGYGNDVVGVADKDSSLALFCTIESIE